MFRGFLLSQTSHRKLYLKVNKLPEDFRELTRNYRQDVLTEKHESYFHWRYSGNEMVAIAIGENQVLLPYNEDDLKSIDVLYYFANGQNNVMTIFLTDKRFEDAFHYVAIAEKIPDKGVFVTTFLHNTHYLVDFLQN